MSQDKQTYIVDGTDLRYGGQVYPEGSPIELTAEEATKLSDRLLSDDGQPLPGLDDDQVLEELNLTKTALTEADRQNAELETQVKDLKDKVAAEAEAKAAAETEAAELKAQVKDLTAKVAKLEAEAAKTAKKEANK